MKKLLIFILTLFCLYLYSSERTMDSAGTVYQITGTQVNENPSLQINIYFNNGTKTWISVPGTEDSNAETFANLFYSLNTSNLFILYSKEKSDGSDLFLQVMHRDYTFSEAYLISEGISNTTCINPKIYQTYKIIQNENGIKTLIQLLHLIWWQKGSVEEAVYANIPIVLNNIDIDAKTIIHLSDLISFEPRNFEGEVSPFLYEYPEIIIPKPNENKLTLLFSDLSSLSYIILDFDYDGSETLRDRAHFPDIGVRLPFPMPLNLFPSSSPEFILGSENKVALLMQSNEVFDFSFFCSDWNPLTRISNAKDFYEAKDFVKRIIEDPLF